MKTITAVRIIISFYLLTTMITTPTAIKTEQIPTEVPLTSPTERNNNYIYIDNFKIFSICMPLYIEKILKQSSKIKGYLPSNYSLCFCSHITYSASILKFLPNTMGEWGRGQKYII